MPAPVISASSLNFLKNLAKNNDRDWFNANKHRYLKEYEEFIAFADALLREMNKHDVIETVSGKKSALRIYRDTRFSKIKTPYKTNWGAYFKRATKFRRGSYYLHIEPGKSFVECGFWGPEPADLKRIRDEFAYDIKPLKKILNSKSFRANFGTLQGESVKTTPKGFRAEHPGIDFIRLKQFLVVRNFTDKEVLHKNFLGEVNSTMKKMRPFLDYMTEILTTDANGEML